ncbi:hypothetical protein AQZ52_05660 [Novosphingobium fuchskuhlense]|uniref:Flagellar hook-length control protein-like C-terminal domain-containing protein n=1 Tax=Novosphingobium fuchskuhlense TaxID=1117702 RepID=A0A117UXK5_9SPHN|nr:hypothetical protein [Novosphingobium fuchskuhlense]KUR72716.1 hypothetical protein AQZ52_05660 [Novosphingobium fuchskuhlense]
MTVPASALLPGPAAPASAQAAGVAPAVSAALPGTPSSETAGFAAHLAREVPVAPEALFIAAVKALAPTSAPTSAPTPSAAPSAASPEEPAITPDLPAEPGKALPPTRQKPAASPAALMLAVRQGLVAAPAQADDTAQPPETDAPGQPTAADAPPGLAPVLTIAPVPALAMPALPQPVAGAAPKSARPEQRASLAAPRPATVAATVPPATVPTAAVTAVPTAVPIGAAASQTAQTAHPAAFAVAGLVFEREAAADSAPQTATPAEGLPESAGQNAARAQPSTLAALTGAPAPERPAARRLPAETERALPTAKAAALPVPETAGALAQALPSTAAVTAPQAPSTASTPQPISFDQLVDSIARARDGLEPAGPVSVALRHTEFGRISLRIEGDATGLSVAMASPDPAFAPAVAAAHAAVAAAEPGRPAPGDHRAETPGQNPAQGQTPAQGQSQSGGQQRQGAYGPAPQRPSANPARSPAPGTERRGGIFA